MRVLIACEYSGVVREAFKAKGHDAWSCDLLPTDIPGQHYEGDVFDLRDQHWDLVIAHPPCTYLAVSGNRWYADRPDLFEPAIEFAKQFQSWGDKVCIENPVGRLSRWRKPDQYVQPWMFGEPFEKKTGLWLKGLKQLEPTNEVIPEPRTVLTSGKSLPTWYNLSPGPERAKLRSKTFQGLADAMAEQWG